MFTQMKPEVETLVKEYGTDNPPPPAQLFTIKHSPGEGNVHLVQKVFKGPFEVREEIVLMPGTNWLTSFSSMFYSRLDLPLNL